MKKQLQHSWHPVILSENHQLSEVSPRIPTRDSHQQPSYTPRKLSWKRWKIPIFQGCKKTWIPILLRPVMETWQYLLSSPFWLGFKLDTLSVAWLAFSLQWKTLFLEGGQPCLYDGSKERRGIFYLHWSHEKSSMWVFIKKTGRPMLMLWDMQSLPWTHLLTWHALVTRRHGYKNSPPQTTESVVFAKLTV